MKPLVPFCLIPLLAGCAAAAQAPADIPSGHWAREAVLEVVARGVLLAPGGKFQGDKVVTRSELAIALARFARSFDKSGWPGGPARPLPSKAPPTESGGKPVNRYELASVLDRVAHILTPGLPEARGKTFSASEALPAVAKVTVPKSDPAYEAVTYLAKSRMAFGPSVALKPGPAPVTPTELADALSMVIAGLTDRYTDEPQNREDLGPPPAHKRQ